LCCYNYLTREQREGTLETRADRYKNWHLEIGSNRARADERKADRIDFYEISETQSRREAKNPQSLFSKKTFKI
jgi:hypothetical protein